MHQKYSLEGKALKLSFSPLQNTVNTSWQYTITGTHVLCSHNINQPPLAVILQKYTLPVGTLTLFGSINLWAFDPNTEGVTSACIACAFSLQWGSYMGNWHFFIVQYVALQLPPVDFSLHCTDNSSNPMIGEKRRHFLTGIFVKLRWLNSVISSRERWPEFKPAASWGAMTTCVWYDAESKGFSGSCGRFAVQR